MSWKIVRTESRVFICTLDSTIQMRRNSSAGTTRILDFYLLEVEILCHVGGNGSGVMDTWQVCSTFHNPSEHDLEKLLRIVRRFNKSMNATREAMRDRSFGACVVAFYNAIKATRVWYRPVQGSAEWVRDYDLRAKLQALGDNFAKVHPV